MHAPRKTLMVALLCASAATAQTGGPSGNGGLVALCHDTTGQDRQPDFSPSAGFDWTSVSLTNDNPPAIRLNTNLEVLNTEHIYFPFTQQVSVSYLYESAGNSAALGYFYYKDLITRGYINTNGTPKDSSDDKLADSDNNGIADFHEDLYSLSMTRDYIGGTNRRCPSRTFTFNGKTFYEPELALRECNTGTFITQTLKDARPGQTSRNISVHLVGQAPSANRSGSQFSDQGLYPTIPNLLEPIDDKNKRVSADSTEKGRGIGHLIFLHSDDDTDTSTYNNMTPVGDSSGQFNGIPDYNASAYDQDGRPLVTPPDNQLNEERDRTVNLGEIKGDEEIVFYMVSWGNPNHAPGGGSPQVYPCLSFDPAPGGACKLHLVSPTVVFFSKTLLNMDQNALAPTTARDAAGNNISVVAKRDIGCAYGAGTCNQTGEALEGWLDQATLNRLQTEPAYRNLNMPHEKAYVKADTSGRNVLPHVLVGAPSTDKFRWVLGFEDLSGGGDRDFNDVSFMIHKSNGGVVRSAVVSGDLSPSISQDYTITEVTFRAVDEPYYSSTNPALCRTRPAEDRPRITYQVALDCKVCTANCSTTNPTLSVNDNPTWTDVPLDEPPANGAQRDSTATIRDFLQRSLTGSQLCWRSIMRSKDDTCQPTIRNINVSYKAMKAGDYGRAAVSTVANTVLYGAYETPGRTWFENGVTQPSTRVVDGRLDLAERGHLYLKELYKPEIPTATTGRLLWDGGRKLGEVVSSEEPTGWRKLITMRPNNTRAELKDVLLDNNGGEAFSSTNCGAANGGRWVCDLDGSGGTPGAEDRALLRNWLYGWERRNGTASTNQKRTWPMGGIQLSTPAIIGGGSTPPWWTRVTGTEQAKFTSNFMADARVSQRSTVAYVGTTQGYLHGVQAGALRMKDDPCTPERDARGHFEGCNDSRNYGTARELFAYLPRKLLPNYVESYLRQGNGKRALVDASPSVADVDLGFGSYNPTGGNTSTQPAWTIGTNPGPTEGAKTVLVTPTGPSLGVVFALDITDPSHPSYPQPMWEFDMANDAVSMSGVSDAPTSVTSMTVEDAFADMNADLVPDTRGSRHSTPIVRMDFGAQGGRKWVAVVGTDYVPNAGTAGALYLLDMKTGLPVQVTGSKAASRLAGVVPLADGEGVGGEPAAVDANEDGSYDLIYAATTGGKLFRISTTQVDPERGLGKTFRVCELADVKQRLSTEGRSDAQHQGVYSSISVRLQAGATGKVVRVYLGTANNPDISDEPADLANPRPHGYVLAYEDANPTANNCANATHLWTQQLGEGQLVWGGVAIAGDSVYTTTAVGKAANACELSPTDSGSFYAFASNTGVAMPNSGTPLGGHGLSTPVVHDEHLIMLTADGKVMVKGDPARWNNQTATTNSGPVRIRVWDASASGRLQP
ncbi:DUF4114 domain-containing protein [Archangium lipolyticum]|uniref:DUF4114 domain-containing protein n=1 Tax=Archangium lipolyticum TaxID=2970465 RepID=UPI00214A55FB|nr:DUF4114 domain-containing protein [Archangium lipolyticum]